jgi:Fe2+ or Zn2+ uptake regulation protein
VLPAAEHGHIYCHSCGGTWEIGEDEGAALLDALAATHQFAADLSHVTISGLCAACVEASA